MELINYSDVKSEDLPAPAEGAKIRWLIDQSTGAPNFGMMFVEVKPGGQTLMHSHPWEHEWFFLEGSGEVVRARRPKY